MADYVKPPKRRRLPWGRRREPPKSGIVKHRGIKIPVGPHITPWIWELMNEYEENEAKVVEQRLEPDDVVVELGGGIGFISALCAKRIGSASVHVYEANPSLKSPIEELYRLNDIAPDLHMYALGPNSGEAQFYVAEDFWSSSSLQPQPNTPARSKLSVQVKAFEDEMALFPRRPNFLIIDIEGGEYDFLHKVALTGINKILCEIHPSVLGVELVNDLEAHLRRGGFERDYAVGTNQVWYLERVQPA